MAYKVILDPGHGGRDSGAVYEGRAEKDDTLQLAMAVADILDSKGVDTVLTRTEDIYDTPFQKAQKGNEEGGDLFVSIHRNAFETPNTGTGVEALVYDNSGVKSQVGEQVNKNLAELGYEDRGLTERPNLVVLRRTQMPAVLLEVGFIDNEKDNQLFDEKFYQIAQGIADGIVEGLEQENQVRAQGYGPVGESGKAADPNAGDNQNPSQSDCPRCRDCEEMKSAKWYRVQTGAFRNDTYAKRMVSQLMRMGYPAYILYENDLYKVLVGGYRELDNAARMEECLRAMGYNTYIKAM